MAIKSSDSEKPKFLRFEKEDVPHLDSAIEECIDLLTEQGIEGVAGEPEVTIVLKNNCIVGDDRRFNMIVFIGASTQEVAEDLNSRG